MISNDENTFHEFCDRAKEHIQQSSGLLREAIEALPHAFYIVDAKTYQIQLANSATAMYGEINEGTTCHELTHNRSIPCDGKDHTCPLQEMTITKKPVTIEHIHYDENNNARIFEVHGYPIYDQKGEVVQMIEYTLDITDRKKTEQELQSAYGELEARVKERTKEIEKANKALRQEIAKHKETESKLVAHQQNLRSVTSELTIAEERQRRRLAIDLHDSIGQALAISQMKLSQIQSSIEDNQIVEKLNDVHDMLDDAVQHMQTMTFELSPPLLYEIGLDAALEWLTESFQERHGIQTAFYNNKKERIRDDDVRLMLYRIVRELLINVVKHANAEHVDITLNSRNDAVNIKIEDDGIGFDPGQTHGRHHHEDGFGLFSIGERLNFIGGKFDIKSHPGKGTKVILSVPNSTSIAQ